MTNVLNPSQNSMLLATDDDGIPIYGERPQNPYGLPIRNQYGQFQIGAANQFSNLGGNIGMLDALYEMAPVIGDYRAGQRVQEASRPTVTPDLMGGAKVGIESPYTAAFESATMMPVIGDLAAVAKVGAATLTPLLGAMAMRYGDDAAESLAKYAKSQRGIIGSTGAATADLKLLSQADEMKAAGNSADDIYAQTHWWLDHPDGRPRFEIDDSGAGLMLEGSGSIGPEFRGNLQGRSALPFHHAIEHPELQKAYPVEMTQFGPKKGTELPRFQVGDTFDGTRGMYSEDKNQILLKASLPKDTADSTALHELQHAVQGREGMARGGSPVVMQAEYDAARARLNFLENEPEYKYVTGELDKKFSEVLDSDLPMSEYTKLEESAMRGSDVFRQAREQMEILQGMKNKQGFDAYKALAGEAEARLVQDRMNMTMDERLAPGNEFYKKFDVPLEDQIVRMEAAKQADSLPMDEASRVARADEMGLPKDAYHGTFGSADEDYPLGFDEFDTGQSGGVWLTERPEYADNFTNGRRALSGEVYPVKIPDESELMSVSLDDIESPSEDIIYEAMNGGYKGLVGPSGGGDGGQYFIFDPKNIRSKFAKFDPAKKNSVKMLAGGAAAAIGAGALMDRDEYVTR